MATHCFEYKGHQVVVITDGDDNKHWGWSYSIDSGTPTPSRTQTLTHATEAVEKAIRHSKRCIDGFPRPQTSNWHEMH